MHVVNVWGVAILAGLGYGHKRGPGSTADKIPHTRSLGASDIKMHCEAGITPYDIGRVKVHGSGRRKRVGGQKDSGRCGNPQ